MNIKNTDLQEKNLDYVVRNHDLQAKVLALEETLNRPSQDNSTQTARRSTRVQAQSQERMTITNERIQTFFNVNRQREPQDEVNQQQEEKDQNEEMNN